jgi:electron transfer flavoprotein beta subunit
VKIGVLLKQVPDTETKIKIKSDNSGIEDSGIKWVINPFDEFAVEEALKLKEKAAGSEVVIVTAGPARAVEAIRTPSRWVQTAASGLILAASLLTASNRYASSSVIKEENFDVVFAGKQAVDGDCAQVVQATSEFCGLPYVLPIEKFAPRGDLKGAVVERPVSGGIKELIDADFPAIFGVRRA